MQLFDSFGEDGGELLEAGAVLEQPHHPLLADRVQRAHHRQLHHRFLLLLPLGPIGGEDRIVKDLVDDGLQAELVEPLVERPHR
eukprot:3170617-Prymnesium_polylepis.1